ncbi:MAG TPA: hypothetical protein GX705_05120 [Clostridiales bacterium]|nr:hypothetical protein [Clostridiales bacterium]
MKKNIFSVIALAVSIINLILSILIVFTLVPSTAKSNKLITKVASNLDLEIESTVGLDDEKKKVSLKDIEMYPLEELTINLKSVKGETKSHFALVSVSLSMNKTHKDYKELSPNMKTYESYITEIITDEFSKSTAANVMEDKDLIKERILSRLEDKFNSDFIVNISIGKIVVD